MVHSNKKDACQWTIIHCHDQAIHWQTRILHTAEEIVPVIEGILDNLQSAGYCEKETFAIRLALEEALVNAIKHGHRGDPRKEVQLRYHHTPECLLVEIEDQGPGFKREGLPDPCAPGNLERPCGRGLLLMQRYMTWVRFNDAGNRVTMCRHRISA
jgi:serine/threonine-protein kinase RsbW